ncbi:hypothetical protein A3860_18580 [Niastella vici]|uniref:Peptidase S24/S26A/S26B/S26C domain-containing protein n=1 Tax=Niastella vici TaxID=1703345 RepID=A0A1V9G296_9BACT|nr:hypothetical protein [Niastella vici]OQP64765.1 hypothetical protein A3860_18580 [Niastella vici]
MEKKLTKKNVVRCEDSHNAQRLILWLPFAPHLKAEILFLTKDPGSVHLVDGQPGLLVRTARYKHIGLIHGYIPVLDDRYSPVYMKGDWIGVRRLPNPHLINYGLEYLAFNQDNKGLLCKLMPHKEKEKVLLQFHNGWYRPQVWKREQIQALFTIEILVPKLP